MVDAAVLVGYLSVFLLGGAKRLADRTFDNLLDRLVARLVEGLGDRPLAHLSEGPGEPEVETWVAAGLDEAMRQNPQLARDLGSIMRELDKRGGRAVVQDVRAQVIHGSVVGGPVVVERGGRFTGGHYVYVPHPNDFSSAPLLAKVLVGSGVVLLLVGVALAGLALYDYSSQPAGPRAGGIPDGLPQAAVAFFSGLVAMAIGGVVKAFSSDPHR